MNYKDDFNEWANLFQCEQGRDPSLCECEAFREEWLGHISDLIKAERENMQ